MLQELGPHPVDLAHDEAAVVGDDQRLRRTQPLDELGDDPLLLFFSIRLTSSNDSARMRAGQREVSILLGPPRLDFCPERLPAVSGEGVVDGRSYAAASPSSSSSTTPRVRAGSTLMPGPIELASVMERMYRPLAAAGLARTISSTTAA